MKALTLNKTNQEILDILKPIENRLIIKKNNKQTAKMYFDYDKDTRLEIISTHYIYESKQPLKEKGETIVSSNNLSVYGDPTNKDDIHLGLLVSDKGLVPNKTRIGVITNINEEEITIVTIYASHTIEWNEF